MKAKLRATVVCEWEEDSDNWDQFSLKTVEELLEAVRNYAKDDYSYFLDANIASYKIEEATP